MATDTFKFTGACSANYDNFLGPFLFEPYGKEMASRIPKTTIHSVLEMACGTGRVTRHLREQLPPSVKLTASDLSPDMMEVAKTKVKGDVEFLVADMQNLPFKDNGFDVVVCQFGIMFPPDKQKIFDQAYRVLKPGGTFLFSTWEKTDRVEIFKLIYNEHILPFFKGEETSRFLIPFSLHDTHQLQLLLNNSHFNNAKIERVVLKGISQSASDIVKGHFTTHAIGLEIAERNRQVFESMAQQMEKTIIDRFSNNPVVCELAAYYGSGTKPMS